jgi:hypothetical protein
MTVPTFAVAGADFSCRWEESIRSFCAQVFGNFHEIIFSATENLFDFATTLNEVFRAAVCAAFMASTGLASVLDDLIINAKRRLFGKNRVRRTRVYCVGMGKTGTHSLAAMFSRNVRAAHEPWATRLISEILDWKSRKISEAQFVQWILERDREMGLEVDASNLNYLFLDILLREFSDAKYIHSIRDCYSWLDSIMNHQLRYPKLDPQWMRLREYRFGRLVDACYAPEDLVLKERGLHPLEIYFSLWKSHNEEVLAKVPTERLFIVRTGDIRKRAYEIADFCGLPRHTIQPEQTHAFQNPEKQLSLRQLDRAHLERLVEKYCEPLMTQFFPEIKTLDDAKV